MSVEDVVKYLDENPFNYELIYHQDIIIGVINEFSYELGTNFLEASKDVLKTDIIVYIDDSKCGRQIVCRYSGKLIWSIKAEDAKSKLGTTYDIPNNFYTLKIDDDLNLLPMKDVRLFLVERGAEDDMAKYGECESILVACETAEQAKDVMGWTSFRDGVNLDILEVKELSKQYNEEIYYPEVIMITNGIF